MLTSSTTKISAPKSARMVAPRKAITAPTRNESRTTRGTASSPTSSMWCTVEVSRKREGSFTRRTSLTRFSPRKLTSVVASLRLPCTAAPSRASAAPNPYSRLRAGLSSCTSSIAATSAWWSGWKVKPEESRPWRLANRISRSTPSVSSRSTPVASIAAIPSGACSSACPISSVWRSVQRPCRHSRAGSAGSACALGGVTGGDMRRTGKGGWPGRRGP